MLGRQLDLGTGLANVAQILQFYHVITLLFNSRYSNARPLPRKPVLNPRSFLFWFCFMIWLLLSKHGSPRLSLCHKSHFCSMTGA